MPPFDVLSLFSAGRSRGLTLVPIIQSLAQLEKNYGKEGAEIVCDNCQDTIFGGFAPQSKTAEALSAALGSRTVLSGFVSQGKESSQSLQMMERALMTPDELKSIPKGEFVVMKRELIPCAPNCVSSWIGASPLTRTAIGCRSGQPERLPMLTRANSFAASIGAAQKSL